MGKKNSIALKVSAIFSCVGAALTTFSCLCILFNWFQASEIFNQTFTQIMGSPASSWSTSYKYMVLMESVIGIGINIYAGNTFLKLTKQKYVTIGTGKFVLYTAFVQLLFGGNFIASIIAIVVGANLNSKLQKASRDFETARNFPLASKVSYLKHLLSINQITQEQYDIEFNKLLEEEAQKNIR